jgi:predicted AAA+ superfamily ATPase
LSSNLHGIPLRPRIATKRVTAWLRRSPALAILGARQSGKSTLARLAFPDFVYIDLERPVDLTRAAQDPEFLLSQSPPLVIDEAQRLPELFPVLTSFEEPEIQRHWLSPIDYRLEIVRWG